MLQTVVKREHVRPIPLRTAPHMHQGIPHSRRGSLGKQRVPAQAYPFFEAIAIMEEVRTQCNTASST